MQTLFREIRENSAKWTGKQGQPAETGMSWRVWESRTCAWSTTKKLFLNSWEGIKQFGGIRTAGCICCPGGAACLGGSSHHRWSWWFPRCEFCFDSISFLFPNPSSFFLFFPFLYSTFFFMFRVTQRQVLTVKEQW